jgi:hypothetical protein
VLYVPRKQKKKRLHGCMLASCHWPNQEDRWGTGFELLFMSSSVDVNFIGSTDWPRLWDEVMELSVGKLETKSAGTCTNRRPKLNLSWLLLEWQDAIINKPLNTTFYQYSINWKQQAAQIEVQTQLTRAGRERYYSVDMMEHSLQLDLA